MAYKKYHLRVGGVVGVGFNAAESYLLVVSHSGRGVFEVTTWQKVARDTEMAYPIDGYATGIGPIHGERIKVTELDSDHDACLATSDGRYELYCESSGITVTVLRE